MKDYNENARTYTWKELIDHAIETNCWIRNSHIEGEPYWGGVWFTPEALIVFLKDKNIALDQHSDLMDSERWTVDDPFEFIQTGSTDANNHMSQVNKFALKYHDYKKNKRS